MWCLMILNENFQRIISLKVVRKWHITRVIFSRNSGCFKIVFIDRPCSINLTGAKIVQS